MTPEEKMEFEKNKNIQEMINDYLKENGYMTLTEKFAANGKHEVLGILTAEHKIMLQQMLIKKYPDINARIREKRNTTDGPGQILSALSSIEWELIEDMLLEYQQKKELGEIPDMEYLVESSVKVA